MSKAARRKDIDQLAGTLESIIDKIVEIRSAVADETVDRIRRNRQDDQLPQLLARVEGLLGGVKVALERMGGTTLPAFREDVTGLRAEMHRMGTEMAGYAADQVKLSNFIKALHVQHTDDTPQPAPPPKRRGRRDKAALDEIQNLDLMEQWRSELDQDVAEAEAKTKRRPGRPKKVKPLEDDTSQKLIDEPEQEVAEG